MPVVSAHFRSLCLSDGVRSGAVVVVQLTDFVKVERKVSGNGAVEPSLEERRPGVSQDTRAAGVACTDSSHARKHRLVYKPHTHTHTHIHTHTKPFNDHLSSALHPSRVAKSIPASAAVRAGMSPLPGGR